MILFFEKIGEKYEKKIRKIEIYRDDGNRNETFITLSNSRE